MVSRLNVSVSSQNCNSLNVSTSLRGQAAKIVSILNLNTDIIFLSDIRLSGKHRQMEDAFRLNYKLIHNSTQSRRGVAILLRNDLAVEVLEEVRDNQENILLLKVRIDNADLLIGAIYGPNTNDFTFFNFLYAALERFRDLPLLLGGDWNATFSDLPVERNPDIFSMRAVPSTRRTARILQMCEDRQLSDPFRSLNPEERDFTYIPSGVLRSNRSRIDYFLVSDCIFGQIKSCTIAPSFCKKSFDHRPIFLSFKKERKKGRNVMNNSVINNPLIECCIKLSIWETYLDTMEFMPGGITAAIFETECEKLVGIEQYFNELIFLQGKGVFQDLDEDELRRQDELHELTAEAWATVSPYARLQQYPRNCEDDEFFEKLILNTSKAALKLQNLAKRAEVQYRDKLCTELRGYKTMAGYNEHH